MGLHYLSEEAAAPGTPPANQVVYYPKADGLLYWKDDAGTEYPMGTSILGMSKLIYGFTYANNSIDATNDIDIAAGGAMDSTGTSWIIGSALTKQSDAAWAVGTNAGALDTGTVGNNDYYIWAIKRPDTGVVDYLFSLSSTAPSMPTNYTLKKLIGWFRREAASIAAISVTEIEGGGIHLRFTTPTSDVTLANTLTTSRRLDLIRVPSAFSVLANIQIRAYDAASAFGVFCGDPAIADGTPNGDVRYTSAVVTVSVAYLCQQWSKTNSSGQIAARASIATVDEYHVSTLGFTWDRRN